MRTLGFLRQRGTVSGLLVLLTLLAYLPAASWGSFHFDDVHSIVENEGVRTLANVPRFFVNPQLWSGEPGNAMYRPVLLVTYAIDYAVWRDNATGWLLTNVLIHAVAAVLVYRLVLRLSLSPLASAFAGAVFALHPAISEVQNYVSSRSESVAAVAMLTALHLYLTARRASGVPRTVWLAGAFVVAGLAFLAKETTAGFFLAVGWFEAVMTPGGLRERLRAAIVPTAVFGVGFVAVMLLRRHMLGNAVADLSLVKTAPGSDLQVGGGRSILDNALTQSRVVVLYLQTLLRPVRLDVDHDVAIVQTPTIAVCAAFAIQLGVAALVLGAARRGARLLPLCWGWFWIFLAPSVVIPLNVVMNEHRLYLPMIAVALLAGAALARVAALVGERSGSVAQGALVAAAPLVCFVPLDIQRSREWRTDESLWTVAVERAPLSARAHLHLGAVWHTQANDTYERDERVRLLDLALAEYARSEELHPDWSDLQLDIGNARLARGRALHARTDFERALAAYERFGAIVGRDKPRPRLLQAVAWAELGEYDRAIAIMRELRAEDSHAVTTLYDDPLARFLRRKGDRAGAAEAMRRVIDVEEPIGRVDGLLDLAWWHFEDGDLDGAQALIQRGLALADKDPTLFKPYLWAARFLVLTGKATEAEEMFRLARRHGWSALEAEVRWVAGGATPGVYAGTVGGLTRPVTGSAAAPPDPPGRPGPPDAR